MTVYDTLELCHLKSIDMILCITMLLLILCTIVCINLCITVFVEKLHINF